MRWTENVARVGARRVAYRIFVAIAERGDHLEDPGADGRLILT
jgi:hypothetical protein